MLKYALGIVKDESLPLHIKHNMMQLKELTIYDLKH